MNSDFPPTPPPDLIERLQSRFAVQRHPVAAFFSAPFRALRDAFRNWQWKKLPPEIHFKKIADSGLTHLVLKNLHLSSREGAQALVSSEKPRWQAIGLCQKAAKGPLTLQEREQLCKLLQDNVIDWEFIKATPLEQGREELFLALMTVKESQVDLRELLDSEHGDVAIRAWLATPQADRPAFPLKALEKPIRWDRFSEDEKKQWQGVLEANEEVRRSFFHHVIQEKAWGLFPDVYLLNSSTMEQFWGQRDGLQINPHGMDAKGETLISYYILHEKMENPFFLTLLKEPRMKEAFQGYPLDVQRKAYTFLLRKLKEASTQEEWQQLATDYAPLFAALQDFQGKHLLTGFPMANLSAYCDFLSKFVLNEGTELFGVTAHSKDKTGTTAALQLLQQFNAQKDEAAKLRLKTTLMQVLRETPSLESYAPQERILFLKFLHRAYLELEFQRLGSPEEKEVVAFLETGTPPGEWKVEHLRLLMQFKDPERLKQLQEKFTPSIKESLEALYTSLEGQERPQALALFAACEQWKMVVTLCQDVKQLLQLQLPAAEFSTPIQTHLLVEAQVAPSYAAQLIKAKKCDFRNLNTLSFEDQRALALLVKRSGNPISKFPTPLQLSVFLEEKEFGQLQYLEITVEEITAYFTGKRQQFPSDEEHLKMEEKRLLFHLEWVLEARKETALPSDRQLCRWIQTASNLSKGNEEAPIGDFQELLDLWEACTQSGFLPSTIEIEGDQVEVNRELAIQRIHRLKNEAFYEDSKEKISEESQRIFQKCLSKLQALPLEEAAGYLEQILVWSGRCPTRYEQEILQLDAILFPKAHESFLAMVQEAYQVSLREGFLVASKAATVHNTDAAQIRTNFEFAKRYDTWPIFENRCFRTYRVALAFSLLQEVLSAQEGHPMRELGYQFVEQWFNAQLKKPFDKAHPLFREVMCKRESTAEETVGVVTVGSDDIVNMSLFPYTDEDKLTPEVVENYRRFLRGKCKSDQLAINEANLPLEVKALEGKAREEKLRQELRRSWWNCFCSQSFHPDPKNQEWLDPRWHSVLNESSDFLPTG